MNVETSMFTPLVYYMNVIEFRALWVQFSLLSVRFKLMRYVYIWL